MKAKKQAETKSLNSHTNSRNGSKVGVTQAKKKKAEMAADELLLEAWKRLYAKRDQFISMWD